MIADEITRVLEYWSEEISRHGSLSGHRFRAGCAALRQIAAAAQQAELGIDQETSLPDDEDIIDFAAHAAQRAAERFVEEQGLTVVPKQPDGGGAA